MFYLITAGSDYGCQEAIYKLVSGILVLRDKGQHDNLAGNAMAADFEGLSLKRAHQRIKTENSTGSGHSYCGCHACTWCIAIRKLNNDEIPPHLTYNQPKIVFAIKEALRVYREKDA